MAAPSTPARQHCSSKPSLHAWRCTPSVFFGWNIVSGSTRSQRSYLRLVNPGIESSRITINAYDDGGARRGPVELSPPAGHARHVTASELETGTGLDRGRLGTGSGRWWLHGERDAAGSVMSLLQTPTGRLTNLSGVPGMTDTASPPPLPPIQPDLVVQSPSVSDSSLNPGQSFDFDHTVRNQGGTQSAATLIQFYQSTHATPTRADTSLGVLGVARPCRFRQKRRKGALDRTIHPGTYSYGACVDSVSGESNTTNNCSSPVTVTVGGGRRPPGLVFESSGASDSSPSPSGYIVLNAVVRSASCPQVWLGDPRRLPVCR